MAEMSDMRFLTVAEVADLMRVSKMTVYRLVHAGELPAAQRRFHGIKVHDRPPRGVHQHRAGGQPRQIARPDQTARLARQRRMHGKH
ncbi:MAG: helix-turn-helix domain-containing protein, partial [Microbacterium sp.]|nr:helix-turn-helix domain-containing protein [Microbacterium sp.]